MVCVFIFSSHPTHLITLLFFGFCIHLFTNRQSFVLLSFVRWARRKLALTIECLHSACAGCSFVYLTNIAFHCIVSKFLCVHMKVNQKESIQYYIFGCISVTTDGLSST